LFEFSLALQRFFSNELLRDDKEGSVQGVLYFNGSHFYGGSDTGFLTSQQNLAKFSQVTE